MGEGGAFGGPKNYWGTKFIGGSHYFGGNTKWRIWRNVVQSNVVQYEYPKYAVYLLPRGRHITSLVLPHLKPAIGILQASFSMWYVVLVSWPLSGKAV